MAPRLRRAPLHPLSTHLALHGPEIGVPARGQRGKCRYGVTCPDLPLFPPKTTQVSPPPPPPRDSLDSRQQLLLRDVIRELVRATINTEKRENC